MQTPFAKLTRLVPGLLMVTVVAIAASRMGALLPTVGAPIVAILMGVLLRWALGMPERLAPGVAYAGKRILQLAIVLIGAGLSLKSVWHTGAQSFVVMVGTLVIALGGGLLVGKMLKLPRNITTLITVGTSVCGASAISAISPIVAAEEGEIAYSISTIFLFNIVAVLLFPLIGHLFNFSSTQFGMWAGTAINDTSSVVAAGYSFSVAAGQYATVVKLTRSLAIIPISLLLALQTSLQPGTKTRTASIRFPLFILGFLCMSTLDTIGLFGTNGGATISGIGQFCIVIALAGIGFGTNLKSLRQTGYRPILMGLITWGLVAVSSLLLQTVAHW